MRVLLADSHPKVRWALRIFIQEETEFTVVGEASDADTLLSQVRLLQPDLILLEWELTGMLADKLLPALCALAPAVRVIVLSSQGESERDALDAGANGFVSKANGPEKLLTMLHRLAKKQDP